MLELACADFAGCLLALARGRRCRPRRSLHFGHGCLGGAVVGLDLELICTCAMAALTSKAVRASGCIRMVLLLLGA